MADESKETSADQKVADEKQNEKPDWRAETFKARSEREHLQKQVDELSPKVKDLESKVEASKSQSSELLRLRISYEKGVPSHLLKLVTATTEADIKDQVDSIMSELVKANSEDKSTDEKSDEKKSDEKPKEKKDEKPKPKSNGEQSWLEKYNSSDLATRKKMDAEIAASGKSPW